MACGVPVVTHEVQGPGEIVPYKDLFVPKSESIFDGGTILMIANPLEAMHTLLKAYKNRASLIKLAEIGRREVELKYDIRIVANRWVDIFCIGMNVY